VTGWIKRGPVGLIGHTKSDAMETVEALLEVQGSLWSPSSTDPRAIPGLLAGRRCDYTNLSDWYNLDEEEKMRGALQGKERLKVVSRREMLSLASTKTP